MQQKAGKQADRKAMERKEGGVGVSVGSHSHLNFALPRFHGTNVSVRAN